MLFRRYPLKNYPYVLPVPKNEYNTTFIWSGLKCINPHLQKCYVFFHTGDSVIDRQEIKYPNHLSRVDYIETVHVKVYDDNMYSENDELFIRYLEEQHSNSSQSAEVEIHPLTQKPPPSKHAEEQCLSRKTQNSLNPEVERTFERLLAQHAKQDLPSGDPSSV